MRLARLAPSLLLLTLLLAGQTQPATAPKIDTARYPDLDAARRTMTSDTPAYLSLFQTMEMSAKTGSPITGDTPAARQAELHRRYAAAVEQFTPAEIETLDWYVAKLDPLVADYPLYAGTPWRFIKIAPNIENGFSHTRGDAIVLTAARVKQLSTLRDRKPATAATSAPGLVLLHEKTHIVQRQHPKLMRDLYTTVWHFEHPDHLDLGPWLTERQLSNPDAADTRWIYKMPADAAATQPADRYFLAAVALTGAGSSVPKDFSGAALIAVELEKTADGFTAKIGADHKPIYHDLDTMTDFNQAFAPDNQPYHPNEIFADLFALLIAKDSAAREKGQPLTQQKPFAPLRTWLKTNFAKPLPPEPQ